MLPERGALGKYAKSVFFEDYNEIDIYIEDTALGSEKIISKIYSRIFEGRYKIDQVFPLGGRGEVIAKFQQEKEKIKRPTLFIVDGDIYHLTGDHIKNEIGLYRLPCYCVENLMLDPNALHTVMDEEDPVRTEAELIKEFDFDGWRESNEPRLRDLFIEYAVSRVLNPSEPTITYDVKLLVSGADGCIDETKLSKRLEDLAAKSIARAGEENYQYARKKIIDTYRDSSLEDLDLISGKDYLLPLLKTRLRSTVKTTISDLNLKIRLSTKCSIEKILNSKDYVLNDRYARTVHANSISEPL